jgi:2-polyprenyl-3-methyl-5-hydroxy-6-metoxy-1,4-benzoquinol methylase
VLSVGGGRLRLYVHRCADCSHRFLFTTEAEQGAIESGYDHAYVGFRRDDKFSRRIREELRERFLPRVPPPARVLDVGCGNGEFIAAAREFGYEAEGVDISEDSARLCAARGVKSHRGDFLTFPFEGRYDLVTMWDVLEHLRSPGEFVARAESLLSERGVLALKVPGYGALNFPLVRAHNRLARVILKAPNHVQYFNRESLQRLLALSSLGRVEWLEMRGLRERPKAAAFRKRVGRTVAALLNRASNNRNLYVIAGRGNE